MGCHDGVNATEAANATPWNPDVSQVGDPRRNHPVGVRYAQSARLGSAGRFHPADLLPTKVRLPDGQVSCVSCHDLYASDRYHLTVPIEGSDLCFACHNLD